MAIIELPPNMIDDVGIWASSSYYNMTLRAAIDVDMWSYRRTPALLSSGSYGQGPTYNALHTNASSPWRIWSGYFMFRAGFTELYMGGLLADFLAPVKMKTYVDGVLKNTVNLGVPTSFGFVVDISSGYTPGQFVKVEVWIDGEGSTASTRFAKWEIMDAHVGPLTKSGWPGAPTFTTQLDAAKWNNLSAALQ